MLLACSLDPGRNTIPRKIGVLVGIHINSWITLHLAYQVYNCFILPLNQNPNSALLENCEINYNKTYSR